MKVKLISSRFLNAKANGETAGDWVAEAKYAYNVVPNVNQQDEVLLQVWAKLNMDFSKSGEMEYVCELIYLFSAFDVRLDYDLLIHTAHSCYKDLEALFDRENVVDRSDPDLVIWTPMDIEDVKLLVDQSFSAL